MVGALLWLFNTVVLLYILAIFVVLVVSWLAAFKVIDPQQPFVARVMQGLFALTNPVLNPLRRAIPVHRRARLRSDRRHAAAGVRPPCGSTAW